MCAYCLCHRPRDFDPEFGPVLWPFFLFFLCLIVQLSLCCEGGESLLAVWGSDDESGCLLHSGGCQAPASFRSQSLREGLETASVIIDPVYICHQIAFWVKWSQIQLKTFTNTYIVISSLKTGQYKFGCIWCGLWQNLNRGVWHLWLYPGCLHKWWCVTTCEDEF